MNVQRQSGGRFGVMGLALVSALVGWLWVAGGLDDPTVAAPVPAASAPTSEPVCPGPFQPNWDSLGQYQCPDWFRDAKFGIWAHWSAQCQPEQGDWYARNMYIPGHAQYKFHLGKYGHPSKVGFKDICHLWKAEKWEPEKLIQLYKRAGAKYFVALANHHCNFDCWDSKYQPWNSVNIGPGKDIVGAWAAAARKEGLRFGVTVHAARAWSWYEVAQGADKDGPMAGVPYDGKLTKADGKGQWWEGYDPQDLYAQNHKPGERPDQAYVDKFYNRVIDLVNKHRPDLLYFDDGVLPLNRISDAGLKIAAHYYNASTTWHDGRNEAVMNTKGLPANLRKALVWDIERGRSDRLEPHPWQTDTCIGSWHYNAGIFERHRYKTPATVITTLIDIVSKNGNLLLNIPVKGDGTIDPDEVNILEGLAAWMDVNGEGIFGTRPWVIFGEGAADVSGGGSFNEGRARPYAAQDIRFTRKGDAIYAFTLGVPDKEVLLRSMGKSSPLVQGEIAEVRLLGHDGKLEFRRDDEGLRIRPPDKRACEHAVAFRIAGLKTVDSADTSKLPWAPRPAPAAAPPRTTAPARRTGPAATVTPAADGSLLLAADLADLHGSRIRTETRGGRPSIGYWDDPKDWASWKVKFAQAGSYEATISVATNKGESEFILELAGQQLTAKAPQTGGWESFQTVSIGKIQVAQPGEAAVNVRPRDAGTWKAVNLAWIALKPAK